MALSERPTLSTIDNAKKLISTARTIIDKLELEIESIQSRHEKSLCYTWLDLNLHPYAEEAKYIVRTIQNKFYGTTPEEFKAVSYDNELVVECYDRQYSIKTLNTLNLPQVGLYFKKVRNHYKVRNL